MYAMVRVIRCAVVYRQGYWLYSLFLYSLFDGPCGVRCNPSITPSHVGLHRASILREDTIGREQPMLRAGQLHVEMEPFPSKGLSFLLSCKWHFKAGPQQGGKRNATASSYARLSFFLSWRKAQYTCSLYIDTVIASKQKKKREEVPTTLSNA